MNPYTVRRNDLFGRYLVASRDIKEGEVIMKQAPMMVGAQIDAFLTCFRCWSALEHSEATSCAACNVAPICHEACKGSKHPEQECDLLKGTKLTHKDLLSNPQIIMPLRCLLLRSYDSDKWHEFLQLEAHLASRRDTYIWRAHQHGVERVLRELRCLEEDLDAELVQKVCGILDVNSFELRCGVSNGSFFDPTRFLRGLYLTPALMAHDCTGNTHLSIDENYVMTIHASSLIPKNEIIYFNYTNGLQGTMERRRHLKEGKYFDCMCARCSDATEMGTNLSALICPKCKKGHVNCTEPLKGSYDVPWKCTECNAVYKGALIKTTINLCKEKINSFNGLKEAEDVLEKLKLTLMPHHYLILELKQNLVSLRNISTERKAYLCREMLGIIKLLEPGLSRHAGITQYELHNALVDMANKQYGAKEIKSAEFLKNLKEAEILLVAGIKCLVYEPKGSPEGRLAQRALTDLRVLRRTMSDLTQILLLEPSEEKKTRKQRKHNN